MARTPDDDQPRTEANYGLPGQTISAAAAKLTALAAEMDYHAAATGPRTYQLVRRRRQRLRRRTQAMTLTFIEDRSGPRVLVLGDIDTVLLEHLTGQKAGGTMNSVASTLVTDDAVSPTFTPPVVRYELPAEDDRRVRPAAPAGGLISVVPGAPAEAEPISTNVESNSGPLPAPIIDEPPLTSSPAPSTSPFATPPPSSSPFASAPSVPGTPQSSAHGDQDAGGLTVKRGSVAAPPRAAVAILVMPDGASRPLGSPVMVGRNPDPAIGPPAATGLTVDDPSLSKSHCVVDMAGESCVVTDLFSTNGTRIESGGIEIQLVPGVPSPPLALPVTLWAGKVRFEVRFGPHA